MLIQARRAREIADYDLEEEITESAASGMIKEGKDFLKIIKTILGCS